MPASHYTRSSSVSGSSRASVSSGSSAGSVGSVGQKSSSNGGHRPRAGSSSFHVGRERDRSAEMELFSQSRKPRSNYRRPSSLGLAKSALPDKTEFRAQFAPKPSGRGHIVPKTPDTLRIPHAIFDQDTEAKVNYKNLSPARPIIHKIHDTLKPEGHFAQKSETSTVYENKNAVRPIIHRLRDHSEEVQPRGAMTQNSEYRNNFAKAHQRGERVAPAWVTNFEKVTIDGADTSRQ